MDSVVSVVLPAAGTGERMKMKVAKQFCEVQGKPVMCHTISAFLQYSWISDVVVVYPPDKHSLVVSALKTADLLEKVSLVPGGTTRHRSIMNGMKHLEQDPPDIVIIHDAVRPIVPRHVLEEVVREAKLHGGAGPVVPLVSTVLKIDSKGFLEESLDRSRYVASEMPQAFQYQLLLKAYERCTEEDYTNGTECLALLHKHCGVAPKLVPGADELFKVTYRKDLYAAAGMLQDAHNTLP
ncbi:D-ribitol-5-phosphate cytidylyltransferase [Rhipicephalus sanguineus]|uniref:D-ribitol-5-phosphate cytidylyltransferase n=1 Tax=Rhipicephalus sanguineus TaxID=34632 RepID=UPI0018938F0A|nr:D-ribitol-5-phosphate cytidylyltransferase [Rhipicephalus sanguineus]